MVEFWICFGRNASQVALVIKNSLADAEDLRDMDSIPGSGRSPGGEHGSPHQDSCLEDPMDRGAWQATVHRLTRDGRNLVTEQPHTQRLLLVLFTGER